MIKAQDYLDEGNNYFHQKQYEQSVKSYTKAIEINPNEPTYYVNRAQSYRFTRQWENAYADSTKAIELDDQTYKSFLINGMSLIHIAIKDETSERMEKGLMRIVKARKLGKASNQDAYISKLIWIAKKFLWYKEKEIADNRYEIIFPILKNHILNSSNCQIIKQYWIENIEKNLLRCRKTRGGIPSIFICPLNNKLMMDPVVTSEGNSYDCESLLHFIQNIGYIDPITKKSIKQSLLPNRNIKDAIESFLNINPWAYNYNSSDCLENLQFIDK